MAIKQFVLKSDQEILNDLQEMFPNAGVTAYVGLTKTLTGDNLDNYNLSKIASYLDSANAMKWDTIA